MLEPTADTILPHPDADINIFELQDGERRVEIRPRSSDMFIPVSSCVTRYSADLLQTILKYKGPTFLCDEINREQDPLYVQADLEKDILSYVPASELAGKRLLDFGCGSAASTIILARMFPDTEIIGIDLFEENLLVARERCDFYGYTNLLFLQSPSGTELPPNIGKFDYIMMSAVFEHLLPEERPVTLPKVWSVLAPGGILFLDQTPHRYFPVEIHSSHLPLLNYLPDGLAGWAARKFSPRIPDNESWPDLLRGGIRGGSAHQVMGILKSADHSATLLKPSQDGIRDRIDLWYATATARGPSLAKKGVKYGMKLLKWTTGRQLAPSLSLAIQKGKPG